MLQGMPGGTIGAYAHLFPGEQLQIVLASITAGNTAARLWVADSDNAANPVALLWDKGNNVFYLAGQDVAEETRDSLRQIITSQIRPQAIAEGRAYFRARALTTGLDKTVPELFQDIVLRDLFELFFGFRREQPGKVSPSRVPGAEFVPIDGRLLAHRELANLDQVRAEIRWMWGSEERFLMHGFGYAAVIPDRVICWCTAEYVSPQRCGIGIATDPAFERRGVATATAAQFVAECLRRGKRPYWECAAGNPASARVAEKAGFELLEQTRFWAGSLNA